MGRVADATRELVRAPASRRAHRYAATHVERDGADGAHRRHVQQRLALVVLLAPAVPFPGFLVLGQPEPAPMLAPARGGIEVQWVDEREAPEVLRRGSGEECVPRTVWGEVERPCELRGITCSGEESQCEGAARGQNVGVRCGRARECQGCLEFILPMRRDAD